MRLCVLLLLLWPLLINAQTESRELGGLLGSRPTLLVLHSSKIADGGWQLAGEYVVLTTLQRRFLEGEASPEIGEFVWLSAADCTEQCGSQAYLEPVVIDRRGYCRLLRPENPK